MFHPLVLEPLPTELAERLEKPEPRASRVVASLDDGLLHEAPDELGDGLLGEPVVGADRRDGVELEPADEDGQARPQQALGVAQQPIAPVDRGVERLLPRGGAPVAGPEGGDPGGEPLVERLEAERLQADRRELERKGDAIEVRADAEDRGGVRLVEREAVLDGRGALDEERDRVGADDGRQRGVSARPAARAWERRRRPHRSRRAPACSWQGSADPGRRGAGRRREQRPHRGRVRSCRGSAARACRR